LLRRVPQAKLVPVEGAPHGLPLLKPEAMIAIVLPFLKAQGVTSTRKPEMETVVDPDL